MREGCGEGGREGGRSLRLCRCLRVLHLSSSQRSNPSGARRRRSEERRSPSSISSLRLVLLATSSSILLLVPELSAEEKLHQRRQWAVTVPAGRITRTMCGSG